MVAQQDVLARERAVLERDVDVLGQTDDGGRVDGDPGGVEHVAVVLLHPRDALENHHHRAPLGADVDRLVGGVQD